ncbi:helix-turn-helix transcriptional regulator [Chryseobacterium sp. MYb264]|uniref:helix-turn-helix transcriptional regulator n=1 Tax=Chryseobacterium sp. MYb264 TaxID=2745153 RepID=UPI002E0E37AC|nr:helix-turn-helix transcriptional regulator [Chryseobacterium sp. MYb264]
MIQACTKTQKVEKYKRELIHHYILLMATVLFIFTIIFAFFIRDHIMPWYTAGGLFILVYSYIIVVRKKYSIHKLVHSYMILGTLYNFYVMLAFWENSVASFVWLLPIPLGAYVFFSRKYVIFYSLFVMLCILLGFLLSKNINLNFPEHRTENVRITDTLLVLSNVAVISLIIFYKDKIRRVEIEHEIEQKHDPKKESSEKAEVIDEEVFEKIKAFMEKNKPYKEPGFNISKLSAALDINSNYISKAIRQHNFTNFNSYLNTYRINYVKELMKDSNWEKVTLMYVYTEAGFSNQSTFNRVFKQIEKITPSEYIHLKIKEAS